MVHSNLHSNALPEKVPQRFSEVIKYISKFQFFQFAQKCLCNLHRWNPDSKIKKEAYSQ